MNKSLSDMHGISGALLITIDNALWGVNAVSLGIATPLVCLIAFVFTGTGVFLVQKNMSGDNTGLAITKGFIVGILAGVPTGILGIAGAGLILGKAGHRAFRGRR